MISRNCKWFCGIFSISDCIYFQILPRKPNNWRVPSAIVRFTPERLRVALIGSALIGSDRRFPFGTSLVGSVRPRSARGRSDLIGAFRSFLRKAGSVGDFLPLAYLQRKNISPTEKKNRKNERNLKCED